MSQPAVQPVHTSVPGRARFSVAGLKRNEKARRALESGLLGRGIRSVSASTTTGSVLVLFEVERDLVDITRRIREAAERAFDPQAQGSDAGPAWHTMDADLVLAAVGSSSRGLSEAEAQGRLADTGANAIPAVSGRSQLEILVGQLNSLPIALLAVGAVLSVATGGLLDAAIILGVIGLNSAIGYLAEARAEETIGSLSESRAPVARVLRDGTECALPAEELVPGDVIELQRDELVPADARVIAGNGLSVNEALLTGESAPVSKASKLVAQRSAPIGDRRNMVFRGTVVTGGGGRAVVVATGQDSELGRIQSLLGSEDPAGNTVAAATRCAGPPAGVRLGGSLRIVCGHRADPRVYPCCRCQRRYFAGNRCGSRRFADAGDNDPRSGDPGSATSPYHRSPAERGRRPRRDRCGLLRQDRHIDGQRHERRSALLERNTGPAHRRAIPHRCRLGLGLRRRSRAQPLVRARRPLQRHRAARRAGSQVNGSATETALVRAAVRAGLDAAAIRLRHPRRATVQRADDRRYMATFHQETAGRELVAVKGDPGEVLALCRWRWRDGVLTSLEAADRSAIETENLAMSKAALRVLGFAYRSAAEADAGVVIEQDFIWVGLVGMADPIRRGARELIAAFHRAAIICVMLTGDQRATAAAVADELGLSSGHPEEIVEAHELDGFTGLPEGGTSLPRVFARVTPSQKLQLVRKLQRSGLAVAMIGDGVNDTPPLRAADIGIALGRSGVEAARGIADVVLLEDELAALIDAVERSRTVAINIRKSIRYLVATDLSEVVFMLAAAAAGRVQALSPIQLLWINLLTDILPALGLAMEPAPSDLMMGPPGDASAPVLSRTEFGLLTRDAGMMAASAFAAQIVAARFGNSGQTVGFSSLVAAQLFYAFACRSRNRSALPVGQVPSNPFFFGAMGIAFAAQLAALFLPGFRHLFGPTLGLADFGISVAAGAAPLLALELLPRPRPA